MVNLSLKEGQDVSFTISDYNSSSNLTGRLSIDVLTFLESAGGWISRGMEFNHPVTQSFSHSVIQSLTKKKALLPKSLSRSLKIVFLISLLRIA
jgi:hypothetical protein